VTVIVAVTAVFFVG